MDFGAFAWFCNILRQSQISRFAKPIQACATATDVGHRAQAEIDSTNHHGLQAMAMAMVARNATLTVPAASRSNARCFAAAPHRSHSVSIAWVGFGEALLYKANCHSSVCDSHPFVACGVTKEFNVGSTLQRSIRDKCWFRVC